MRRRYGHTRWYKYSRMGRYAKREWERHIAIAVEEESPNEKWELAWLVNNTKGKDYEIETSSNAERQALM